MRTRTATVTVEAVGTHAGDASLSIINVVDADGRRTQLVLSEESLQMLAERLDTHLRARKRG